MESSWQQLNPKSPFTVVVDRQMGTINWDVLSQLYLPIIGPTAFSVYAMLTTLPSTQLRGAHTTLIQRLGIDLPQFYTARRRLEGAGLLTTRQAAGPVTATFSYQMRPPLTPAAFFQDDLLSVHLLAAVGEETYQALVSLYAQPTPLGQDITENFLTVYHVDQQQVTKLPETVAEGRAHFDVRSGSEVALPAADFDFALLGDILKRTYVDVDQLNQYRHLIVTEHITYGITEPDMARYIQQATDVANNQFDADHFKRLIAQAFSQQYPGTVSAVPEQAPVAKTAISPATQQLLKTAEETAPLAFLQGIKAQTGGFVTSGEERIVRDLVGRQLFSAGVLNMMVYHVLVDEDRATLNKNLLQTIANDWSKAGLKTAEQALAYIKQRAQKAAEKSGTARSGRRGQTRVKETLPDWAKDDAAEESVTLVSPEEQAALKAQLAALRRKPGQDGEE